MEQEASGVVKRRDSGQVGTLITGEILSKKKFHYKLFSNTILLDYCDSSFVTYSPEADVSCI